MDPESDKSLSEILGVMPGGSTRDALAKFVASNSDRIRAIARRKLTSGTRAVFDSEDVLVSVMRRLDDMALKGRLRPRSEGEVWALITAIAQNTAVSKTRLIERAREALAEDGQFAALFLNRLNSCGNDDEATLLVHRMLMSIADSDDRHLLSLVLRGANHAAIAGLLGVSEPASRQRWMRLRRDLAERFEQGLLDERT